jgi:uncharacterized membrane protein
MLSLRQRTHACAVRFGLLGLALFIATFMACSSQTASSAISTQWNVKSVTTKSATGEVTRADVTGYFIFTSATQPSTGSDGKTPAAVGTFVEDVTLSRIRRVQAASYTVTAKTLSLLVGDQTQVYAYKITTVDGVQTMTWDSQDETAAHWILEVADVQDAGADASTDANGD